MNEGGADAAWVPGGAMAPTLLLNALGGGPAAMTSIIPGGTPICGADAAPPPCLITNGAPMGAMPVAPLLTTIGAGTMVGGALPLAGIIPTSICGGADPGRTIGAGAPTGICWTACICGACIVVELANCWPGKLKPAPSIVYILEPGVGVCSHITEGSEGNSEPPGVMSWDPTERAEYVCFIGVMSPQLDLRSLPIPEAPGETCMPLGIALKLDVGPRLRTPIGSKGGTVSPFSAEASVIALELALRTTRLRLKNSYVRMFS